MSKSAVIKMDDGTELHVYTVKPERTGIEHVNIVYDNRRTRKKFIIRPETNNSITIHFRQEP